jgi:hypothetical protein
MKVSGSTDCMSFRGVSAVADRASSIYEYPRVGPGRQEAKPSQRTARTNQRSIEHCQLRPD